MLKLSIPYSILNAISTSIVSLTLGVKQQEETNSKLKASILKTNTKNAKTLELSLEDYLKQKEEREEKTFKNLLKRISITDLIEINTKVFQVTKAEESVDITIDDQYIVDCIQVSTNVALRLLRPLADASVIFEEELEKVEAIENKWFPEKETTIESKVVDASKVPTEVKQKVSGSSNSPSWEVTIEKDNTPKPFFLDSDHEKHINVYSVKVHNTTTKDTYEVLRTDCMSILETEVNGNLKELAQKVKLPITAIKAIRTAYGQTQFTG